MILKNHSNDLKLAKRRHIPLADTPTALDVTITQDFTPSWLADSESKTLASIPQADTSFKFLRWVTVEDKRGHSFAFLFNSIRQSS